MTAVNDAQAQEQRASALFVSCKSGLPFALGTRTDLPQQSTLVMPTMPLCSDRSPIPTVQSQHAFDMMPISTDEADAFAYITVHHSNTSEHSCASHDSAL